MARGPFLVVAVWMAQISDWLRVQGLLVQGLLALFQVLVEGALASPSLPQLQSAS